jgi:hypothetical protein
MRRTTYDWTREQGIRLQRLGLTARGVFDHVCIQRFANIVGSPCLMTSGL